MMAMGRRLVDREPKKYTLTITKDSYERLLFTKELLKKKFNESYAYADIINAALVLMNKELFERNNMEVLGYLSLFKEERLIKTRLEKLRQLQMLSEEGGAKKESDEFEELLKRVINVPGVTAIVKSGQSKSEKDEGSSDD
ncbi:hypothetical protein [Thermococcus sp. LS2]|uniref:hypothetical protein n=1 Tax=Thermococcus sp. LS2 TaxID=1638260 RepID=UPI00143BACE0|nr:hypothetical protein [Thermococcus sp. LS2]NJE13354.1 hypothetical protein [Thermococcus sp. LS2]